MTETSGESAAGTTRTVHGALDGPRVTVKAAKPATRSRGSPPNGWASMVAEREPAGGPSRSTRYCPVFGTDSTPLQRSQLRPVGVAWLPKRGPGSRREATHGPSHGGLTK